MMSAMYLMHVMFRFELVTHADACPLSCPQHVALDMLQFCMNKPVVLSDEVC